tara:strand:+ start:903 stop:2159 length:1257 start_codon:yes stop_codon:yes gene_type:complete
MKFLQKERSKLGNAPGTIINWGVSIPDNDPNFAQIIDKLPAGYLRCDGSVYDERDYPELARILGVGETSLYKKSDQALAATQFQVPDLGSKHIEAASSSNVGSYRNINKVVGTGENATTIQKAGVGVEMFSNVGNTATIGFNGAFTIPPQTFDMIGSIGWTLPTTTETTSVPAGAIGSHGHFSGGTRVAVKESAEFPNRSTPYYLSAADVNLTAESGETYGGLCNEVARHYWQNVLAGSYGQGGPGICNGGNCASFKNHFLGYSHQNGANLTLIPPMSTANPPQNIAASNWVPDKTISGNDVVTATSWPNTAPAPGINVGLQRPYDTVNDDVSDPVYPTARNVEETCGVPPGSDTLDATLHSHIIDREIGDTDYTCTTAVATMRPDGLEASVNISTSGVNKFDDIVSPYIVMEFLIKY